MKEHKLIDWNEWLHMMIAKQQEIAVCDAAYILKEQYTVMDIIRHIDNIIKSAKPGQRVPIIPSLEFVEDVMERLVVSGYVRAYQPNIDSTVWYFTNNIKYPKDHYAKNN